MRKKTTLPKPIPPKTIERVSEYRRSLRTCLRHGITRIYSHELSELHGSTAVQVRRDLMLIGYSCDTKKGYFIEDMIAHISRLLDDEKRTPVAILGMGRVGQALANFFKRKPSNMDIVAAFDVDEAKIGSTFDDVPCYHIDSLQKVAREKGVKIAIIAAPTDDAHSLITPIVEAGITGVLNFTLEPLNFPPHVVAEHYDLTAKLEKIAFQIKERASN